MADDEINLNLKGTPLKGFAAPLPWAELFADQLKEVPPVDFGGVMKSIENVGKSFGKVSAANAKVQAYENATQNNGMTLTHTGSITLSPTASTVDVYVPLHAPYQALQWGWDPATWSSTSIEPPKAVETPKPANTRVYLNGKHCDTLWGDWRLYEPRKVQPDSCPIIYAQNGEGQYWRYYQGLPGGGFVGPKTVSGRYLPWLNSAVALGVLITPGSVPHSTDPQFKADPHLPVGGVDVTVSEIREAIDLLKAHSGNLTRAPLLKGGSRLADADHGAMWAEEKKHDYSLRTGAGKTKRAVIRHLTSISNGLTIHVDALLGPAVPPPPDPAAPLVFAYAENQPTLSGYHRKALLVDQHGNQWVFKPATDMAHRFRPEVEHQASVLARLWGFATAESRLLTFDGMYGQAQRLHDVDSVVGNIHTFDDLPVRDLVAIAREHLLDWALDNDDSHGDNMVRTCDGAIIGIDKGRAWRYFGGWQGLSGTTAANSNCQLVSTALFTAIAAQQIPRAVVDQVYKCVIFRAQRMQYLPDSVLTTILNRALENRPHYKPSSYQTPVDGAPTSKEELIAQAIDRKNNLVRDMDILWGSLYERAGWFPPELHPLGVNPQGHLMLSGLLDPGLANNLTRSQFHGVPVFVGGTHIEDAHVLLWRERDVKGSFVVRGQFKVRSVARQAINTWCRTSQVADPDAEDKSMALFVREEKHLFEILITVAKSISFHHDDGKYNDMKSQYLHDSIARVNNLIRMLTEQLDKQETDGDPWAVGQRLKMYELYRHYMERLRDHFWPEKLKTTAEDFPRFVYTPSPAPETPVEETESLVRLVPAARAASTVSSAAPRLDDDGELLIGDAVLSGGHLGQIGMMWQVALPTGEVITAQTGGDTATRLSTRGNVTFTVPCGTDLATGLNRIQTQLAKMGCRLVPATPDDLELFYWRHLAAIAKDRCDTGDATWSKFWEKTSKIDGRTTTAKQLDRWRTAFTAMGCDVAAVRANGTYLPRFMHLNLRHPRQACGKPYWERFDVTGPQVLVKQMPVLSYKRGAGPASKVGAMYCTEARIRALAVWKGGQSSIEDMDHGSAGFVFLRQNYEDNGFIYTAYCNPRILLRTTNFAFRGDMYGDVNNRSAHAHWNFEESTAFADSSNELMVKDALSFIDDIEVATFADEDERKAAIDRFAQYGIHEIRGLPVATRFVASDYQYKVKAAVAAARTVLNREALL